MHQTNGNRRRETSRVFLTKDLESGKIRANVLVSIVFNTLFILSNSSSHGVLGFWGFGVGRFGVVRGSEGFEELRN